MVNSLKNIFEKITHIHMVVYTWWCWHICKGEGVGVEMDQLGEETEANQDTGSARTLATGAPARPISGNRYHAVSIK